MNYGDSLLRNGAKQPPNRTPSSNCIQPPALTLRQQDFVSFSLTGEGGKNAVLHPVQSLIISTAPRHAQGRLFDNLDMMARWRLGAWFCRTGLGDHLKGHTRRPVDFLQRQDFCGLRAKVTENKTGCFCKVHGETQKWSGSHKATKHNPFASSWLRASPINPLPANGHARTVHWPQY